jgi:hypothetical protein
VGAETSADGQAPLAGVAGELTGLEQPVMRAGSEGRPAVSEIGCSPLGLIEVPAIILIGMARSAGIDVPPFLEEAMRDELGHYRVVRRRTVCEKEPECASAEAPRTGVRPLVRFDRQVFGL